MYLHLRFNRLSTCLVPLVALAWLVTAVPALAQVPLAVPVVAVEEDWELHVSVPDPEMCAPQVMTQMNPNSADDHNYGLFCINYQEVPNYDEGGIELQLWEGEQNTTAKASEQMKLKFADETLTWTQQMVLAGGFLQLSVVNGQSATFSNFGGPSFRVTSLGAFDSLDSYDVNQSVENSGVSLAGNRVVTLKLVAVRYHLADGTVLSDTTERVAFNSAE